MPGGILQRLRVPAWVRAVIRQAGFELVRTIPAAHAGTRRMEMFRRAGIDLVLDVGANTGQYARRLREMGYRGRIVSFEPLASAFGPLSRASAADGAWDVEKVALGAEPGTAKLHISGNSWSSSLLDMLPRHLESAPESAVVGSEEVQVQTLAWALERHRAARTFVKIDVQGGERAVLEGAGSALEAVAGLQLEMSLVPLYAGETLFPDMLALLSSRGFTLMDLEPGHRDPATGQLLQVDGIFFRAPPLPRPAGSA